MAIRAGLFDLDGVLVDSKEGNRELFRYIAEQHGFQQPSPNEIDSVFSLTFIDGLIKLFNISKETAIQMAKASGDVGFELGLHLMKTDPLLETVLTRLYTQFPLGVVTSRGRTAYRILGHFNLSNYFKVVIDRTQYQYPKPHPEPLQLAIEKMHVRPSDAFYVDDGDVGMQAANTAGVVPIYFGHRNPNARSIKSLNELEPLLIELT